MVHYKKPGGCKYYKGINQELSAPYKSSHGNDCRHCVYFSSRNCMMNAADSIEPPLNFFG